MEMGFGCTSVWWWKPQAGEQRGGEGARRTVLPSQSSPWTSGKLSLPASRQDMGRGEMKFWGCFVMNALMPSAARYLSWK